MSNPQTSTWYTVYKAKGDELLAIGTAKECAAYLGWTLSTFYSILSRVKSRKNRTYCFAVENLKTGGYWVYGSENTGQLRGRPRKFDVEAAKTLYRAGINDANIAKRVGVSPATIWSWRKEHGLPPNRGQGRPRMKADGNE